MNGVPQIPANHLLRLAVRCPDCGAPPRLRVPASDRSRWEHEDPVRVVLSYECHMRSCGRRYNILVAAFQEAA